MRRLYHALMADYLMRRMERCHSQIAHDSTLWSHHYEQAQLAGRGVSWPMKLLAAAVVACAILSLS